MREDLWRRLLEHDPARAPETPQPAAFYDGVLFAAQAMSETVTRLLAEARAGLSARPVSPTAGEVAEGLAAMEAAGVLERPGQGKKKKAQS